MLEFLANASGATWQVTRESDGYRLTSSGLDSIDDSRELHEQAKRVVEVISGIMSLQFGSEGTIGIAGVGRIEVDRPMSQFVFPDAIRMEMGAGAPPLTVAFVRSSVLLGLTNDVFYKALRLYGSGDRSWSNLYPVFEIMQSSVGGALQEWASKSEIERFCRTANSPLVAGDEARHGDSQHAPPGKPMSKRGARLLIERLLHRWLESGRPKTN